MNSNLQIENSKGFKELLLKKLSFAVTCSVGSHLKVVLLYVCVVNYNSQPLKWFNGIFNTLTSFSTWLHLICFGSIIFAQIVICAKDYVFKGTYKFSRFQQFLSIFSARSFSLGFLHVAVGGLAVWLYLSLAGGKYKQLYVECNEKFYCLDEGNFFLVLGGLWTGLYFFFRVYKVDRRLIFPVIPQDKLLRFKAKFLPLLQESKNAAFNPTMYYFLLYYIFGPYVHTSFAHFFKLRLQNEGFSVWLYVYTWGFSILYNLNMKLMKFCFELFLTEPIQNPIISENDTSLSAALVVGNVPIIQHLACLDLYSLSKWSLQRRQSLFTLSQPGGHPHVWNRLLLVALKAITEFTDSINRSTELLEKEDKSRHITKSEIMNSTMAVLQSPLNQSQKYQRMRNLSFAYSGSPVSDILSPSQQPIELSVTNVAPKMATSRLTNAWKSVENIQTVRYIFGEMPEAHIQHSLQNGQLIVWITQALANIVVASLREDPYGIVQKDLPILITTLVQLKLCVEKLNKHPEFSRRGSGLDDFSFKMKNCVNSAVKRSLYNICKAFGEYINDIPLNKDIAVQLQCYVR